MKANRMRWNALALTCLVTIGTCMAAQSPDTRAARRFVQRFYDWYSPRAMSAKAGPAWNLALKAKTASFSPALRRALRADVNAQAKSTGEIVGLDFDPFLNSQDPELRYVAGTPVASRGSYLVGVHGASATKPAVFAKVESRHGAWRFTNFIYSSGDNLLEVLERLKKLRESGSSHP
ncbi:MAG: hypothetical protein P4L46_15255 [Fimbriimonas sp.]|nr:hypothetical protein [Fimbriimonas sp.]